MNAFAHELITDDTDYAETVSETLRGQKDETPAAFVARALAKRVQWSEGDEVEVTCEHSRVVAGRITYTLGTRQAGQGPLQLARASTAIGRDLDWLLHFGFGKATFRVQNGALHLVELCLTARAGKDEADPAFAERLRRDYYAPLRAAYARQWRTGMGRSSYRTNTTIEESGRKLTRIFLDLVA
jgi:hypothetical protein